MLIFCRMILVHDALLGGLAGLCRYACLVLGPDELSGSGIAACFTVAGGAEV